jgi:CRP-like cAMP-binding protein
MIIRDADLIKGMSQQAIDRIIEISSEENFNLGEVLFEQGDLAEQAFVLKQGALQISVTGVAQPPYLATEPGELVGWSALAGRDRYTATAHATETSMVIRVPRRKLEEVLTSLPADGMVFYRQLAGAVGQRLVKAYAAMA